MSHSDKGSAQQNMMRPGERRMLFIWVCLLATLFVMAAGLLDGGRGFLSIPLKAVLAILAYILIQRSGRAFPSGERERLLPCMILCLIPLLYTVLAYLGSGAGRAELPVYLIVILNAASTALWEELYFRHGWRVFFEENGRCGSGDFLLGALVFGAAHLVNLIIQPFEAVLLQAIFAVLTALFLQAVYVRSGSFGLIVLFHFLSDLVIVLLAEIWVPDPKTRYFPALSAAAPIVLGLYYALCAAVLVRRGELVRPSKFSSFLQGRKGGDTRRSKRR